MYIHIYTVTTLIMNFVCKTVYLPWINVICIPKLCACVYTKNPLHIYFTVDVLHK